MIIEIQKREMGSGTGGLGKLHRAKSHWWVKPDTGWQAKREYIISPEQKYKEEVFRGEEAL